MPMQRPLPKQVRPPGTTGGLGVRGTVMGQGGAAVGAVKKAPPTAPTYKPYDPGGIGQTSQGSTGSGGSGGGAGGAGGAGGGASGSNQAMGYIQQLRKNPGMTPEQVDLLKNNAANQAATARQGSEERIRSQMARSGLSGSGQLQRGLIQSEMGNQAGLSQALSGVDLANANMGRENAIRLAGLGVEAGSNIDRTGLGYAGIGSQEYMQQQQLGQQQNQYGQDFGWQKYLQDVSNQQYGSQQNQYMNMLKKMGIF